MRKSVGEIAPDPDLQDPRPRGLGGGDAGSEGAVEACTNCSMAARDGRAREESRRSCSCSFTELLLVVAAKAPEEFVAAVMPASTVEE